MVTGAVATFEVEAAQGARDEAERTIRVHTIQAGRNVANAVWLRGGGLRSLVRRRRWCEYPVFSYIVEHPEGLLAVDTGLTTRVRVSRLSHRLTGGPMPAIEPDEEVGPQMRRQNLRPEGVRRVVLTHLDFDHVGGLEHFPHAEVLVHRPEYECAIAAKHPVAKLRYRRELWPSWFAPTLYDLDPEPYGPFPLSKRLTGPGDVRLVPIPGHSIGQVGVVIETDRQALFFSGDHVLRQDWFVEDYRAGNLRGIATFPHISLAPNTSRRIRRLAEEKPTLLLPAHDAEAPARLAARTTLSF